MCRYLLSELLMLTFLTDGVANLEAGVNPVLTTTLGQDVPFIVSQPATLVVQLPPGSYTVVIPPNALLGRGTDGIVLGEFRGSFTVNISEDQDDVSVLSLNNDFLFTPF